jgi:uncharacterized protein HemX
MTPPEKARQPSYNGPERRKYSMEDSKWHLDKKVPIALLVGLLFQAAVGLWYAGRVDAGIQQQERRLVALELARLQDDRETSALKEQLAGRLSDMQSDIRWIKDTLSRDAPTRRN